MQLNPGESSLMTYFANEDDALIAMGSLQSNGFHDIQLSFVSEYPQSHINTVRYNLSSKVLGRGTHDQSYGPLLAADPSVSGISGHDSMLKASYLLTVVTDDTQLEKAKKILSTHGAYL
ncbi:MAG: hypothetical protein GX808_07060 [Syntrophomonadaceae bacterium]|nr:hypothetical protein [Syntrophomonadaceae bacterium]